VLSRLAPTHARRRARTLEHFVCMTCVPSSVYSANYDIFQLKCNKTGKTNLASTEIKMAILLYLTKYLPKLVPGCWKHREIFYDSGKISFSTLSQLVSSVF
jgi:hypothetical protein